MHTHRPPDHVSSSAAERAVAGLRDCVHCGFCLPHCPTYQLERDERDSPRGRLYLVKSSLEDPTPDAFRTLTRHLDRCLTCRACETHCPSGVEYAAVVESAREVIEEEGTRSLIDRLRRRFMVRALSSRATMRALVAVGRTLRVALPQGLRRQLSLESQAQTWPRTAHARKMLVLGGCVQPALNTGINVAAANLLDRIGISLERRADQCCGALSLHLGERQGACRMARRNVVLWNQALDAGAEAIVVTSTGCGAMVREYGALLSDAEPDVAAAARRVSEHCRDVSEVLDPADMRSFWKERNQRVAWQAPCTSQHAVRLSTRIELLLTAAGFELSNRDGPQPCCGSAGSYSLLQPERARRLRETRLGSLESSTPDVIATANIGCQAHLAAGTTIPVRHWLELLSD